MLSCWAYGSFNLRKHHKEFSKKRVRLLKDGRPTKHWSLLQYVGVGFDHFMVVLFLCHQNHPVQDGGQLDCCTLILIFVSLLGTGVRRQWLRRWPVRCIMAPLSRESIRPAGGLRDAMEEGGFIINTHSLGVYIILGSSLCSLCSKYNGIFLFSCHVLIGHSSKKHT